jgi:transposase-like protein
MVDAAMRKIRRFTPEEDARILRMRAEGETLAAVAAAVGRPNAASIFERLKVLRRDPNEDRRISRHLHHTASTSIPPEVIAERDRAFACSQDLTAVLLGDPLPGRSALDRRMRRE